MNNEDEVQEHKQEAKWKGLIETTNQTRHMQKLFVYLICRQPLVVKWVHWCLLSMCARAIHCMVYYRHTWLQVHPDVRHLPKVTTEFLVMEFLATFNSRVRVWYDHKMISHVYHIILVSHIYIVSNEWMIHLNMWQIDVLCTWSGLRSVLCIWIYDKNSYSFIFLLICFLILFISHLVCELAHFQLTFYSNIL